MRNIILENGIEIKAKNLTIDSREVKPGSVFCACAGSIAQVATSVVTRSHGIAYAGQAINNGAIAILWEPTSEVTEIPRLCQEIPLYRIEDLHKKLGNLAAQFYQSPSQDMILIGVTGTNGKSSVVEYIAQSLTENGLSCGLIGTLGNGLYGKTISSSHTTPDAIKVQQLLSEMKSSDAQAVAMEVSSHALHQHRVDQVQFNIAVFTNLTQDHLDYHGTMQNYANEKKKLFLYDSLTTAVINLDDNFAQQLLQSINRQQTKVIAYSTRTTKQVMQENSHIDQLIYAEDIQYYGNGSSFQLCVDGQQSVPVKLALIGHFNVSNALACAAVLYALDYKLTDIAGYLSKLKSVAGRMELINNQSNNGIQLIIDYAHTPDALEQSIKALKRHSKNKLWCVFGCGGNRDKEKRSMMASVAVKNADEIIITSDNPRDEDPMAIIEDIRQGTSGFNNYRIEVDRTKAIKLALELAEQGDTILVAGKGHETYQEIKGVKHDYSDRQVCQELLAA